VRQREWPLRAFPSGSKSADSGGLVSLRFRGDTMAFEPASREQAGAFSQT